MLLKDSMLEVTSFSFPRKILAVFKGVLKNTSDYDNQ